MSEVISGIYRKGELILLDDKKPKEGETVTVKILTRKEIVKKLAGVLGEGSVEEAERYLGELHDESST